METVASVSFHPLSNLRESSLDGNRDRNAAHYMMPAYGKTGDRPVDDDRLVTYGENNNTNGAGSMGGTEFKNLEEDAAIWIPPEAAGTEDHDVVAYINDDDNDDECHGGTMNWVQQSSSDSEPSSPSTTPREEERQTAMLDAINRQLKMLVDRSLASAGMSLPQGEEESWLDIITSLSWEAALLIKPDGSVGNQMDPGSYIKVKRVASGRRRQCEVIKGLVFKKCAAHKHMPTKCHNPKLLLLRGALGDSDVGLSSFDSMEQEKDHLEKAISQVIEICAPNVIMVEKTVSRDIQELLLNEGVTLVFDMKLNRLQRIARYSGSPLVSVSEILSMPKLKHCDYFHIEKVAEEHNITGEGGKRPSKTLMFLEGFSKPLGCTILLRGANSEELQKVKQVMLYTVFAAYHLVLETSFFEDQRVFLNDGYASKEGNYVGMKEVSPVISSEIHVLPDGSLPASHIENDVPHNRSLVQYTDGEKTVSSANPDALNPPENGFSSEVAGGTIIHHNSNHTLPSEKLISLPSGSMRKFIDIFHHQNIYLPVTSSQEITNHHKEGRLEPNPDIPSKGFHAREATEEPVNSCENMDNLNDLQKQVMAKTNQQMRLADNLISGKHEQPSVTLENRNHYGTAYISEEKTSGIDDEADDVLDSQSILVLISSQCIPNQVTCEQSHLSRINYYGNFDVSLGQYLKDILQNKNLSCSSCGEPPEDHMYSYTHRKGNLSVIVKRLLPEHRLPGESKGKIWMWTRCLRCEHESGISKSSRRVQISPEARNLSFGKFLELSFSSHSAARRLSICGHLVNRDCLRFFGLGSKVAIFQYSSVKIYTACKPQRTLEFHSSSTRELFEQEARNVLDTGVNLFTEVETLLKHMKNQFPKVVLNCGTFLEFSQLEEMLIKEKAEFTDSLVKAVDQHGISRFSVHENLDVNWLYQDLLLQLYVWDCRLHRLLVCTYTGKERMSNGMKKVTVELTDDRTTTVAEADDNEPVQFSELGMNGHASMLVDETPQDRHYSVISDSLDVQGQGNERITHSMSVKQHSFDIPRFRISEWDDMERWIWSPLYESRLVYRQELQAGSLENFELVNRYSPSHLSTLNKQSAEEVCSRRFVVGPGGNVLSISEDEISSIVSRALAVSEDRRHLLDSIVESQASDTMGGYHAKSMENLSSGGSSPSSPWSSNESSDSEASFSSDDLYNYDSSLLSSSLHPEISVNGRVTLKQKYSVICVHANQFYTLRKKCCSSELAYIASLSRCKKWDAQGGKSKAFFAKTMDDRFIIKQIKKTEFESFIEFAPDYFKHVYHSLDTGSQTCLAKILGIYQVKQTRHGKEVKIDLMVMENLLFGHNISRIYDLKGAVFSRYVTNSSGGDAVYLDQNFVEDMRVSPIYIGGRTKHLLQRAIWNDTSFLTSINVMDYSLLVGVDNENHEFVFGIIDYLRQYTWDKQLETWVKASLVVPKNVLPTVISPREYKKRFRKFMTKYFLTVPDDWSMPNRSESCKYCAHRKCNLSKVDSQKPNHQTEACVIQ